MAEREQIAYGKIGRPNGLKGALRFFPYHPESPVLYEVDAGTLVRGDARLAVHVQQIRHAGSSFLLLLQELGDRDAAARWTNAELWVDRSIFPPIEEAATWYHWQLVGLHALDQSGHDIGRVRAVQDHGAGDILVIHTARGDVDVPFAAPWADRIDLDAGTIVVDPHWLDS